MEEKQVYISFEKQEYRENKAKLLECQINLVNLQKKINHLKAVRSNKKRYLFQLKKSFASTNSIIERLEDKMPEASLPKHLKNKIKKREPLIRSVEAKKSKGKKNEEEVLDLDKELLDIQERLKKLNLK